MFCASDFPGITRCVRTAGLPLFSCVVEDRETSDSVRIFFLTMGELAADWIESCLL